MNFYTNVLQYGGKILIRGIKDGKSFAKRVNYKPSFFIKSKKDNTTFTTLQNEPVEEIQLPSIDKARNFLKQYKNSSNVKLYGMDRFLYQFISDEYKDDIEWNKDYIKIYTNQGDKAILTLSSFKELLDKLPKNHFLRVHRSYVVNINAIRAVQKSKILIGDIRIPIGETYKEEVLKQLNIS